MSKMTLSEGQILTYIFDFRSQISTFRAKNTPKSTSFKAKNDAHRFFFWSQNRSSDFPQMVAKFILFFEMVAAYCSQIFDWSQKKVAEFSITVAPIFLLLTSYFLLAKKWSHFFRWSRNFGRKKTFRRIDLVASNFWSHKNGRMRPFFGFATKKKTYGPGNWKHRSSIYTVLATHSLT